jgi:transcriptional regulator GlxA family with amidase domain
MFKLTRAFSPVFLVLAVAAGASAATASAAKPVNVGVVIFNGVYITEFVAPFDTYKHVGDRANVFTVAPSADLIRTAEGVGVKPDYSFANSPHIDVLVVPSGVNSVSGKTEDDSFLKFIRASGDSAQVVTSHCWGAFTLGRAGLLNSRAATTYVGYSGELGRQFPKVKAVGDKRFVVSGNVVTSQGDLAAYEGALYVVGKLFGWETADKVSKALLFREESRQAVRQALLNSPAKVATASQGPHAE